MAGIKFVASSAEVASGTAVKTLVQIVAATNQRVLVREWWIECKGISNTAAPGFYRILRQTTAGTSSALTLVLWDSTVNETLQTTALQTFSAEPTAGVVLREGEVHPQQGIGWVAPFDSPLVVPGGTRLGIEVTFGASISVVAGIVGEE